MDESEVLRRARQFVAEAGGCTPGDYSNYLNKVNARLERESLAKGESGYTTTTPKRHIITVNDQESEERQNYTICHEIAHIELGLPSNHETVPLWEPVKRDENERYCDMFAAELLMPVAAFRTKMPSCDPSLEVIKQLGEKFHVSFPAAASRYACLASLPCAYVTMTEGRIRHAERSTSLRNLKAWVEPRTAIPQGSVAFRLRAAGQSGSDVDEVAQDIWFKDWPSGLMLSELARHDARHDVTTALLWLAEDDAPNEKEFDRFGRTVEDNGGLPELTGELPWPSRSRR